MTLWGYFPNFGENYQTLKDVTVIQAVTNPLISYKYLHYLVLIIFTIVVGS